MPKMKTRKSVAAKFKLTGTGKLKRNRPGKRHILTKKSSKAKRHMSTPALVHKSVERTMKLLMCV